LGGGDAASYGIWPRRKFCVIGWWPDHNFSVSAQSLLIGKLIFAPLVIPKSYAICNVHVICQENDLRTAWGEPIFAHRKHAAAKTVSISFYTVVVLIASSDLSMSGGRDHSV
jgi:hypothetical protein